MALAVPNDVWQMAQGKDVLRCSSASGVGDMTGPEWPTMSLSAHALRPMTLGLSKRFWLSKWFQPAADSRPFDGGDCADPDACSLEIGRSGV